MVNIFPWITPRSWSACGFNSIEEALFIASFNPFDVAKGIGKFVASTACWTKDPNAGAPLRRFLSTTFTLIFDTPTHAHYSFSALISCYQALTFHPHPSM